MVPCIAAIRRGPSRYFMFPWAEGENLREFWDRNASMGPSHNIIQQTITQLLGMADALTSLHNFRDPQRRNLASNGGSITVPNVNVVRADMHVASLDDVIQNDDDELESHNSVSIRHGDLKPENILRFTVGGHAGLGILKIADMGLAKQHV